MKRIKPFSQNLISKIAAGEVVQGVNSIVKELLENSLDAGSQDISVFLTGGGIDTLVVKDNGSGIIPDDLELSLCRYASSKINSVQSLDKISTYGFRGEALASIAAVSRLEITSRAKGYQAIKLISEGGKILEISPAARSTGTTISVRDIFYNFPARRKFLKTPFAEKMKAKKIFFYLSLSSLNTRFEWVDTEKKPLVLSKNQSLLQRVDKILGNEKSGNMIPFDEYIGDIRIHGLVGEASIASRRPFNLILVNGRPVSDRSITAAVRKGYGNLLVNKYPVFILFLDVSPDKIDVNVHPSKEEIKFLMQTSIFTMVKKVIENTLRTSPFSIKYEITDSEVRKEKEDILQDVQKPLWVKEKINSNEVNKVSSKDTGKIPDFESSDFRQIHNSYIICETKGGFLLIDQHAAAERILFERVIYNIKQETQRLLFPVIITLSEEEWNELNKTKGDKLFKVGFQIKIFSNSVIVEGVPAGLEYLSKEEIQTLVRDILMTEEGDSFYREAAATIACKASIKAGDRLKSQEMEKLVGGLFLCRQPHICPHGRPTMIRFTLKEIEKRLGRT